MNKTIMEMSAEARLLIEFLRPMNDGEFVSYAKMSAHIERDVRGNARTALHTARRTLRKEGVVFDVVINEGIKRMSAVELANSEKPVNAIHRASRRAIETYAIAVNGDLQNDDLVKATAKLAVLGMIHECTDLRKVKRLEATVRENGSKELAIGQTLAAFGK
jgi:hypothetical protein